MSLQLFIRISTNQVFQKSKSRNTHTHHILNTYENIIYHFIFLNLYFLDTAKEKPKIVTFTIFPDSAINSIESFKF